MGIKLTEDQMITLKRMCDIAGKFADQFLHIMKNGRLNLIDGSRLTVTINPEMLFITETVEFGKPGSPAGYIELAKGVHDREFKPTGCKNSAEYELLFADENTRAVMEKHLHREKPLPPDGLWISVFPDNPPVDCGVSVNDGLAE